MESHRMLDTGEQTISGQPCTVKKIQKLNHDVILVSGRQQQQGRVWRWRISFPASHLISLAKLSSTMTLTL